MQWITLSVCSSGPLKLLPTLEIIKTFESDLRKLWLWIWLKGLEFLLQQWKENAKNRCHSIDAWQQLGTVQRTGEVSKQWCILQMNNYQANGIVHPKMVGTRWAEIQHLHSVPLGSSQSPSVWAACASVTSVPGLPSCSPRSCKAKAWANAREKSTKEKVSAAFNVPGEGEMLHESQFTVLGCGDAPSLQSGCLASGH